MITLDETWFYYCTDHELISLAPGETVPKRGQHIIQSRKTMVTIAWNTNGFHVLADLPKGVKINATDYTTEILPHILEWRRTHGTVSNRKLIVHADNARPHTARSSTDFLEANGMKRAPHPPYSPDLALSDFYLFGDVKRRLSECVLSGRDELRSALEGILWGLEKLTLIDVFREWMRRLRICIETKGEYVSSSKGPPQSRLGFIQQVSRC
jgi:hypothetical protein